MTTDPDLNCAIRHLWPADRDAVCAHFLRLDPETRHMRFGGGIGDAQIADYADHLIGYDSEVFGAFVDGELRGVAELRGLYHGWPQSGEAAFSVERGWQNCGIGDALLTRVITVAQNRGVRRLVLYCLRENRRMRHLAEKHQADLQVTEDDIEARLVTGWPTPLSVAQEFAAEMNGLVRTLTLPPPWHV